MYNCLKIIFMKFRQKLIIITTEVKEWIEVIMNKVVIKISGGVHK